MSSSVLVRNNTLIFLFQFIKISLTKSKRLRYQVAQLLLISDNQTLKYCPHFPGRLGATQEDRRFGRCFSNPYRKEHRRFGIALMTPEKVHCEMVQPVYNQRKKAGGH
jgi:hypothetical protein